MTNPQCVWRTGCSAPEQCRLERRCTRSNPEDRERDLELRPSKEQIQPCSHGHTPGLCRLCMLAEIERLRKVYYKANDLIAYIGHQGEISSTAGEVDALQCALDDFDGGIPVSAPEPCHGLPTVERLDSMFAGDDLPPESRNVVSVEVTKEEWQAAKAELIARRHGLTAEQVSNARESLLNAVAERVRAAQPPPVAHSELELAAAHYVRVAQNPNLSRYITENGRHPGSGGPWAELVAAVDAATSTKRLCNHYDHFKRPDGTCLLCITPGERDE